MKAIRRFTVRVTLPEPLAALHGLMLNLRWSWHRPAADLFASIDPAAWAASGGDPIAMLSALPSARIAALAADGEFLGRLAEAERDLRAYVEQAWPILLFPLVALVTLFLLASGASDGHVAFNPPGSPRDRFIRIARSMATHDMSREYVKCWRPPRVSQMPSSGRRQLSHTQSISRTMLVQASYPMGEPYLSYR